MTLVPWKKGKCLLWDVTVVNPLAKSYARDAILEPGRVALNAEARKFRKYSNIDANQYIFYPVAFESFGILGPQADELIVEIGRLLRKSTGEPRSTQFLRQALSMALQRGNCLCVLDTFPEKCGLLELEHI